MSAIACIYHANKEPVPLEHIHGIMGSLQQFPADDIQVWHKEHIFLGCHAQWITPESIGEPLPFYDSERQLVITADAIIDNREELFELLQVEKSKRKTMPDSQLILLAYCKWGQDSPKYLIGDFAFIIWDERNQQLFGARDMSGYRTLYYFKHKSSYGLCTTIEPLLTMPYIKKILNEEWLAEYLAITGLIDTVDASSTPYKHIEQVPPSHYILIKENKISLSRYGSLYSNKSLKLNSSNEYVEAFQDIFQQAVNARLRTSKAISAQLSGGLDSSSVVGFAAKALKNKNQIKQLHTLSYIPPANFIDHTHKLLLADETPFIQATTKYIGIENVHYLPFEGKDSYSEIDNLLEVMEMPYKFLENSFWLKGMFEQAYEYKSGILLNGDRGNFTISWGSAVDYYSILLKKFRWIQLKKELGLFSERIGGAKIKKSALITRLGLPLVNQLLIKNDDGTPSENMINPNFASRTKIYDKLKSFGIQENGWLLKSNIYDERKTLLNDIYPWNHGNTFSCKMSLRYSLWKRDPTNDLRIVRFCLSVPESEYVQDGMDRALIRKATNGILPDKVRLNQLIRGVQGADWLYRMSGYWNVLIEELEEIERNGEVMEYIDQESFSKALGKAKQGVIIENDTDASYKNLMRSLMINRFLKKHF